MIFSPTAVPHWGSGSELVVYKSSPFIQLQSMQTKCVSVCAGEGSGPAGRRFCSPGRLPQTHRPSFSDWKSSFYQRLHAGGRGDGDGRAEPRGCVRLNVLTFAHSHRGAFSLQRLRCSEHVNAIWWRAVPTRAKGLLEFFLMLKTANRCFACFQVQHRCHCPLIRRRRSAGVIYAVDM